jgi:hypothetical protein
VERIALMIAVPTMAVATWAQTSTGYTDGPGRPVPGSAVCGAGKIVAIIRLGKLEAFA